MAEEIRPALTPERWRHLLDPAQCKRDPEECREVDVQGFAGEHDFHAAAARALEGQPFGFTWEDVEEETAAAQVCDHIAGEAERFGHPETNAATMRALAKGCRSRAARIAALLPPREP